MVNIAILRLSAAILFLVLALGPLACTGPRQYIDVTCSKMPGETLVDRETAIQCQTFRQAEAATAAYNEASLYPIESVWPNCSCNLSDVSRKVRNRAPLSQRVLRPVYEGASSHWPADTGAAGIRPSSRRLSGTVTLTSSQRPAPDSNRHRFERQFHPYRNATQSSPRRRQTSAGAAYDFAE